MFELSKHGIVDVIGGEGSLCADTLSELEPLFERIVSQGAPRLVIDMAGTAFIDSVGLEWLLDARDRCSELGGQLHLAAPTPLCREILQITGVSSELEVFDDSLQAVGCFAR